MKKYFFVIISILVFSLLIVFDSLNSYSEKTIYAMDTVMNVKIKGNLGHIEKIEEIILDIDKKFNAYNQNSYVYKLNSGEITTVPSDVSELIGVSLKLSELTEGNFNICLKEIKDLWNINSEKSLIPDEKQINNALKSSDYTKIKISGNEIYLNGCKIDLGGIVKGYATDKIVAYLKESGVKEAVIDLGGNIYAYSDKTSKIGIQKPFSQRGEIVCACEINDKAVVSSGIYERYFEKDGKIYHHIFDSSTGKPADNGILSITVVGNNSTYCDALSTALLVMGEEKTIDFYNKQKNFDFAIYKEGKLICSPGFAVSDYDKKLTIEVID